MSKLKISIITVVWNNSETIKDAINSVLSQRYKNIEYIIVDGASTDGTIEIVESYGDKISKFISEKDKGIYDGINKGISLVKGDVIAFLHSDDIYASDNIIEDVVRIFAKDESLDGIYGDLIYTPKKDTSKVLRYWKSKDFDKSLLAQGWMPAHPTLFLKSDVYEKYGNFDLSFRIAGDYDFMLRVLSSGIKVKYLPKVLYKMRVGGESNKSLKNIIQKSKEDLKALKKNNIGGIGSLLIKNFSKIMQFVKKHKSD
ncbi:glycosyltransferase family 2 protein [Poseidonibacter ostreae]|uniref:Glycosyltransferase n=1 Tax=Poseidonibacter ostreae TaxID=2654171 RepID=A0ABQ6VRE4_9BACT|nr:glycosyltransferase family 2 protein [Poseidonibacter ostreae]KAB7892675.1 glycosyltransferase [Poseidonibacter ostreae]